MSNGMMCGTSLFDWATPKDQKELSHQLRSVLTYLQANDRVTLYELAVYSNGSEAGCSARIRDLKKLGYVIHKAPIKPGSRRYHYWLVKQ